MLIPFYDDYFAYPSFTKESPEEHFKEEYIKSKTANGKIYKFVSITDNAELNQLKLQMLNNDEFWASYYIYFADKREIFRKYNIFNVSRKTRLSIDYIKNFFNTIDEMNSISCFTYEITESMWNFYANETNGFCMEFSLMNTNMFFPVVYIDKNHYDFTNDIISSFMTKDEQRKRDVIKSLAILPWVLKDTKFFHENELRFLCGDEYDDENDIMGGRIAAGKKKMMGVKGKPYKFDYAGLKIDRVYIGKNCQVTNALIEICNSKKLAYELA